MNIGLKHINRGHTLCGKNTTESKIYLEQFEGQNSPFLGSPFIPVTAVSRRHGRKSNRTHGTGLTTFTFAWEGFLCHCRSAETYPDKCNCQDTSLKDASGMLMMFKSHMLLAQQMWCKLHFITVMTAERTVAKQSNKNTTGSASTHLSACHGRRALPSHDGAPCVASQTCRS